MGSTDDIFGPQAPDKASGKEPKIEDKAPETASGEPQVEADAGEKKPYTPEELTAIIASDEQIDTTRLTIEGQALMKSFQRGLTPKLEEMADLKRQLAELQTKKAEPEKPKTWADYFNNDPEATLSYIDQQIASTKAEARQKRAEGDIDGAEALRDKVDEWKDLKTGLVTNKALSLDKELKKDREYLKLTSSVPEYDKKKMAATEYLTSKVGMASAEAEKLLEDVKMVKHFATLSEQSKAPQTLKDKEIKAAPELGRPGPGSANGTKTQKETYNHKEELEAAKQTGNWTKYFERRTQFLGE